MLSAAERGGYTWQDQRHMHAFPTGTTSRGMHAAAPSGDFKLCFNSVPASVGACRDVQGSSGIAAISLDCHSAGNSDIHGASWLIGGMKMRMNTYNVHVNMLCTEKPSRRCKQECLRPTTCIQRYAVAMRAAQFDRGYACFSRLPAKHSVLCTN